MEERLDICPRCGGNAMYVQKLDNDVETHFCFGCGFTSSTLMEVDSKVVLEALEGSPELYKDIMFVDSNNKVWFPSTLTLPGKGMVFVDGTSKDNWRWAAVKSMDIPQEELSKFPKGQTTKMDMKNINYFDKKDFMEALDFIEFFDVPVAEQQ